MIAITLNFKTIEAARQALLEIPSSALVDTTLTKALYVEDPAPKQEKPAKAAKAAPSPAIAEPVAAPEPKIPASDTLPTTSSAAASGAAETTIDYATLQKAVFALAGKSREAAAAVAAGLGVKTFKELAADQWPNALTAVNAKLAELEAA